MKAETVSYIHYYFSLEYKHLKKLAFSQLSRNGNVIKRKVENTVVKKEPYWLHIPCSPHSHYLLFW